MTGLVDSQHRLSFSVLAQLLRRTSALSSRDAPGTKSQLHSSLLSMCAHTYVEHSHVVDSPAASRSKQHCQSPAPQESTGDSSDPSENVSVEHRHPSSDFAQ